MSTPPILANLVFGVQEVYQVHSLQLWVVLSYTQVREQFILELKHSIPLVVTILFISKSRSYKTYCKPKGSSLKLVFRVFTAFASMIFLRIPNDDKELYGKDNKSSQKLPYPGLKYQNSRITFVLFFSFRSFGAVVGKVPNHVSAWGSNSCSQRGWNRLLITTKAFHLTRPLSFLVYQNLQHAQYVL